MKAMGIGKSSGSKVTVIRGPDKVHPLFMFFINGQSFTLPNKVGVLLFSKFIIYFAKVLLYRFRINKRAYVFIVHDSPFLCLYKKNNNERVHILVH